ncbi:MAG: 30S ribosomal protein S3 [Candidatus Paceibacterota bacterium]
MTHVVHPYAQRIGILRGWKSRWFTRDRAKYQEFLRADTAVRAFLEKRLRGMYASTIEIERSNTELRVIIKSSRPGLVIGRSGEGTKKLKDELKKVIRKEGIQDDTNLRIDVEEIRSPESDAGVVAYMVAESLEKRLPFRRVLKQTIEKVIANRDVDGVRITISGRLGGAEMSRKEGLKRGQIPLQTLRSDIDFAREKAYLPYGVIGIKVWINRGEVFEGDDKNQK